MGVRLAFLPNDKYLEVQCFFGRAPRHQGNFVQGHSQAQAVPETSHVPSLAGPVFAQTRADILMMFQLCLSSPNCLEVTTIGPRSMSDN